MTFFTYSKRAESGRSPTDARDGHAVFRCRSLFQRRLGAAFGKTPAVHDVLPLDLTAAVPKDAAVTVIKHGQ